MVKLNKIYTRTGDDGTTGLVDGSRVAKHAARMEAIGVIDEANSAIGFAVAGLGDFQPHVGALVRIQNDLFDLGADLATPGADFSPSEMVLRIIPGQATWIEQQIDALNEHLPPLTSFILPGGSAVAAHLHHARTVCRRVEIGVLDLTAHERVNPQVAIYLNRLSDLLFVLARAANANGQADVLWIPGANR